MKSRLPLLLLAAAIGFLSGCSSPVSERPIFDTAPFTVAGAPAPDGKSAALWVADAEGLYASRGSVELA